jgi:XRE family aerobic/anaerobic benzoate catabolism transcriptional regulator
VPVECCNIMLSPAVFMQYNSPSMDERTDGVLKGLARRIRGIRKQRGETARAIATRAGLSLRFYAQLEAGEANIAIGRLAAVADALSVTLAELVDEPAPPRAVALLGLRGAGKSTIGPLLAKALHVEFVELDARVEERAGLALPEIFALHGEAYYRRLETQCLAQRLENTAPCVIALSGGIVHNPEAHDLVFAKCRTIWLKARPEDHMQRVVAAGDHRPLAGRMNAMAQLRALLSAREPYYKQAEIAVDTSTRAIPQIVEELKTRLERPGL